MAFLRNLNLQKMAVGIVGQKIGIYGGNESGKTNETIKLAKRICKEVNPENPNCAPVVVQFENGTNACGDFYPVDGTNYKNVLELISDYTIENKTARQKTIHDYPVVIFDGAEKIKTIAESYTAKKKDIETLGDLAYGKGFSIYRSYTDAPFIKLMATAGLTIIFIFHDETGEWEDPQTKVTYDSYSYPAGTKKDNSVLKYINDNCDYVFYLDKHVEENGSLSLSVAHCKPTKKYFARNRYSMTANRFDIEPFSADGIYDYVLECSTEYAKANGVEAESLVDKVSSLRMEKSHDELVAEVKKMGKALVGNADAKERTMTIINEVTNDGAVKIDELSDIKLEDLITQYSMIASEKGIEL